MGEGDVMLPVSIELAGDERVPRGGGVGDPAERVDGDPRPSFRDAHRRDRAHALGPVAKGEPEGVDYVFGHPAQRRGPVAGAHDGGGGVRGSLRSVLREHRLEEAGHHREEHLLVPPLVGVSLVVGVAGDEVPGAVVDRAEEIDARQAQLADPPVGPAHHLVVAGVVPVARVAEPDDRHHPRVEAPLEDRGEPRAEARRRRVPILLDPFIAEREGDHHELRPRGGEVVPHSRPHRRGVVAGYRHVDHPAPPRLPQPPQPRRPPVLEVVLRLPARDPPRGDRGAEDGDGHRRTLVGTRRGSRGLRGEDPADGAHGERGEEEGERGVESNRGARGGHGRRRARRSGREWTKGGSRNGGAAWSRGSRRATGAERQKVEAELEAGLEAWWPSSASRRERRPPSDSVFAVEARAFRASLFSGFGETNSGPRASEVRSPVGGAGAWDGSSAKHDPSTDRHDSHDARATIPRIPLPLRLSPGLPGITMNDHSRTPFAPRTDRPVSWRWYWPSALEVGSG